MYRYLLSIKVFFLPFVVIAALLVGGCGSSDDSGEETVSLTKAQFIAQADSICKEGDEQLAQAITVGLEGSGPVSSKAEEEARLKEVVETVLVPAYEERIDQISALSAPNGDEDSIASILSAVQQGLDKAGEQPQGFIGSNARFGQAGKLAKKYGLATCAESFG